MKRGKIFEKSAQNYCSMDTVGYHYVVEASGCDPEVLGNVDKLREILLRAAKNAKMDVKGSYFFKFTPTGVSGTLIVAMSHVSIHTWPEHQYAALDVYVCGEGHDSEKAVSEILAGLKAKHAHITEIRRGVKDNDEFTHIIVTWEE
ncbi:MAG: adenosylmethionine decarboxylase [Candidatus Nezhaarchaeales archaeon]